MKGDKMNEKIIQIIPANGLLAVYKIGEGEELDKVVCLALMEDKEGFRWVAGLVATEMGIESPEDLTNFGGYSFP